MATKRLQIPLAEADVRALKVGDFVTLDGLIYTGATMFHERFAKGILPPIDFSRANVLMHWHPITRVEDGKERLLCITPTSSIRYETYGPDIVTKLKVRAFIGKTTMGPNTTRAMVDFGGVHLTRLAGQDNLLASQVQKIEAIYFAKELGIAEATLLLNVKDFGPFIVSIDAQGNNLFSQLEIETEKRMLELYGRFGISPDFDYPETKAALWSQFVKK
ncbi:MAG: fumarate hydratase C-terminal domain-containing protein [Chloroflexi bacterium]|nr:fumarate hydratase C-terminal domain-containing protein [Chloroflexota bacterium]